MAFFSAVPLDSTFGLLQRGYLWWPELRRRSGGAPISTRLGGRRVTVLAGPEALEFFYDEAQIRRRDAVPGPVRSTLLGHGGVQTLDGPEHRHHKQLLDSTMTPKAEAELVAVAAAAWDQAVAGWNPGSSVVVFDEVARVLTRAVCDWAGIDVADGQVPALATDLVALVDGFATAGPRHWRARAARRRRQRWLAGLVRDVRAGTVGAREGSVLDVVSAHRQGDGALLEPRVAAVELLNVIRPTVAVCWFVTFAAHALHQWPKNRDELRTGDPEFATAFAHEVRRFYPFAPFVGGRAVKDLQWQGHMIPAGSLVIADLYGQNHDEHLWPQPYTFAPERFESHPIDAFELVPQGGGDPRTNHRCPGEGITVGLLEMLSIRLARLEYDVPPQDLGIRANRIPARVSSGFMIST